MTGKVFNIERYHYTDGAGIRILVFLKGCTLRCPWCSNPESQVMTPQLAFNKNKCVNCGRCIAACENHAIFIKDGAVETDLDACVHCGACVKRCFYDARTLFGRDMTVDEVMKEILKDRDFYKRSRGGVTFSGGEAALQPEFVRECTRRCRMEYIDTAIETAGALPWDMLQRATEDMGEILFDIKTLDEDIFRSLLTPGPHTCCASGACAAGEHDLGCSSLSHVLGNLKRLCDMGKKVRIRCPIIPGMNKNEAFIRGVIDIARENKIGRIDLLPFHQLGSYKYKTIGQEYSLQHLKTMAREEVEGFREMIRREGIACVVGG